MSQISPEELKQKKKQVNHVNEKHYLRASTGT